MAKGGKRYWLKFYNNFFDNEKIWHHIEMPENPNKKEIKYIFLV